MVSNEKQVFLQTVVRKSVNAKMRKNRNEHLILDTRLIKCMECSISDTAQRQNFVAAGAVSAKAPKISNNHI